MSVVVWEDLQLITWVHASCDQLITTHSQCSVISQREAIQAFTWDKKQQQQQLAPVFT